MHNRLKEEHEKYICMEFLKNYNSINDRSIRFKRLGSANNKEPDCICTDGISIEICEIPTNEYHAEKRWSTARGIENKGTITLNLSMWENLEQRIFTKLDKLNSGKYSGVNSKIYLVCELYSHLYMDAEIQGLIANHTSFSSDNHFHRFFDEIWLIWKSDNGTATIQRLE